MPACIIILASRLGFFSDVELASLELKWTPCFLSERKCSNFAVRAGFGDPGGDGGISRFGTGGSVRSWTSAREAEKGDVRPLDVFWSSGRGAMLIDAGPSTGPAGAASVTMGTVSSDFVVGTGAAEGMSAGFIGI